MPYTPCIEIRPTSSSRKVVLNKRTSSPIREDPMGSGSPTRRELVNTVLNKVANPSPRRNSLLASSPNKPPMLIILDERMSSKEVFIDSDAPRSEVRKKSGEVVRPVLKPRASKSEPTTPTCPKYVHFDSQLEHVRLFLQAETPTAVIEDSTDDDDDNDDDCPSNSSLICTLPNWPPKPSNPLSKMVHVESASLNQDKTALVGKVYVKNIAFQKRIDVRYTFDFWNTVDEVQAKYMEVLSSTHDVFLFTISLVGKIGGDVAPEDEQNKMDFAVRYHVDDNEFWDNNNGSNYQVGFKRTMSMSKSAAVPIPAKVSKSVAIRDFGTSPPALSSSPDIISDSKSAARKQFFERYDFSASLTAAKKNPTSSQSQAGNRTLTHQRVKSLPSNSIPGDVNISVDGYPASFYPDDYLTLIEPPIAPWDEPDATTSFQKVKYSAPVNCPRPTTNSTSYFDLVQNYCFYGSNANPYSNSPNAVIIS